MAHADFGYTSSDVAEALQRLAAVAAGRALAFPAGLADPQEDVQTRWKAVASVAGKGQEAIAGMALEQLKAVFNYIEAVIISCGAPDSFDVYEVCFEALTKIGFFLTSISAKELLLRVLEDVHEVYDVLLSCVETYEWVQPGATGQLRLWMLQVLFACIGSGHITGRDLMELTENDVSGAVSLISFILRCEQAPFEMQSTAGRCLVELTTADSVFLSRAEEGADDWQNQQITKLTGMLNNHVNGLIKGIIQFDVVEAFGRCICQHQMSHSRTDIVVKHFLTTIHNCLLYCSQNQKKMRQHLATQSTIVQDIMIPYVHNILPALYDNPTCGPSLIEWQNLKSTLQTFVVVTFNINVFRPQLRDADLLPRVCEVPHLLENISMLELLIKIVLNVDYVRGPCSDILTSTLQAAFEQLPLDSQLRLRRRLCSEQSCRLPFTKSSVQATSALAFALRPLEEAEVQAPEAVAASNARKARKKHKCHNSKDKAKKRKKLFAMQHVWKVKAKPGATGAQGQQGDEEEEEEEEDSEEDDDLPPLIPASGWERQLGEANQAGVPSKALCQLSGALMQDPVVTPEGHLFDRAALEDWTSQHQTNPLTGAPLHMEQCAEAVELRTYIQGYQLQMLSVGEIAPEAFDLAPPEPKTLGRLGLSAAAAPASATPAAVPRPVVTGPSLLGDLPSLAKQQEQEQAKKKEKGKIRIESRSVVDCPEDMRCAIDGKVMVNPVRSPLGHNFEKKTLERWIANCGSVCPISGKPLKIEECQPDSDMKKRIVKFLRGQ